MFNEGGQLDHLSFAGVRGGGKGGGGGGGAQPWHSQAYTDPVNGMTFYDHDQWNPGSGAGALDEEIQKRKFAEQQASDAATAKATSDAATAETTFQGKKTSAYNTAMQQAMQAITDQGGDPSAYMDTYIKPALDAQMNQIQDLDPNPGASFAPTLGSTIANQALGSVRNAATRSLNSTFTPNYASTLLPDSTADASINQILSEQFDPLQAGLTNAQKRGTLTDSGYQAAQDSLAQRRSGAASSLRTLGQGILNTDRADINTITGGARTDANALSFGDNFDPSSYAASANTKATGDLASFGGALRSAVGDTKYADLTDLLNVGGAQQGAQNPTATNLNPVPGASGPGASLVDPLANQKRGLGNVGAF